MTDTNYHPPLKCPTCGKSLAFIEYATKEGKNGKIAKWPVYEKCDKKMHSEAARVNKHIAAKKYEETIKQPERPTPAKPKEKSTSPFIPPDLTVQSNFRAPFGAKGIIYQVPRPTRTEERRITIDVLKRLVAAYIKRFDCNPKAIRVCPTDNSQLLEMEAPEDFPIIGVADFLTPGYGYVMLEHPTEILETLLPTDVKETDNGQPLP